MQAIESVTMQPHPLLVPVADLLFPPRCPLCGEGLAAQTGLCSACWGGLAIPGEPCCTACQRPLPDGTGNEAICAPCLASPPRHDGIAAATLYNDASRQLILAFKHGRRIAMAPMLARLMVAQVPPEVDKDWLVIPVPLHRWRLWTRGFNQSALLASEFSKARGSQLVVDALLRLKATPSLGVLGGKSRARILSGAIGVNARQRERLKGSKVLLVDDVLTSVATSGACVAALKRAGAKVVRIACFARVLDEAV